MSKRLFLLLLAALCWIMTACARPAADFYDKNEYWIPMRDGVHLYTSVYSPRATVDAPILIFRTPYGCAPYGEQFAKALDAGFLRQYVDRGYIIVRQDVRGRFMSEGEYVNVRPVGGKIDETTDSYDTVDWLVKNVSGNNGRVGFFGCSYPGFYAMMGGLCNHPAVKAISPQAPVADWFMGDDTHHNGVLMLPDAYGFLPVMSYSGAHTPAMQMPVKKIPAFTPDEYTFFLSHGTLDSLTKLLEPTPFWNQMSEHPDYDEWWQARDLRRACYNVRPAVLVVGGTFDAEDCFGAWNLYKAIRAQSPATYCRLVVGPWAHGAWSYDGRRLGPFDFGEQAGWEYYMEHFELPFFDRYLLGRDDAKDVPPVSVFVTGENRWHTSDKWPLKGAQECTFYLQSGGGLSAHEPAAEGEFSEYLSDPSNPVPYNDSLGERRGRDYMVADQRFTAGRDDVLTFVSEPLEANLTWVGEVNVSLAAAISTTDADFVVKVIDCFSDAGMQMLVRADVMRGRYRRSFSVPEPFVPGQVEEVAFRMPDVAHTFRKGHRLMIQVQSSWFPLAERSPQQFVDLWSCKPSDFVPCRVRIYHRQGEASVIRVPVLGE